MIIYKFSGNTTKLWVAYSTFKDGDNLPNVIEDKPIKWASVEEINTSSLLRNFSKDWLKEIEEHGFYIPNPTIEWGKERIENI